MFDPVFRERLANDPKAAASEILGRALPAGETVAVIEETATRWAFVLPPIDDIEAELPEPTDARSAVENQVYAILRDEPETIETAARDPRAFLQERFGVEVNGVDLRRETAGTTLVVIPHQGAREELDDDMLDLVSAGGHEPTDTGPKG